MMQALYPKRPLPPGLHYLLAVDGGGTATRARLWHRSGRALGQAQAGASGLVQGPAQAWRQIGLVLASAAAGAPLDPHWPAPVAANTALALGLAGANQPQWAAEFLQANPGYAHVDLHSDARTALQGAHGDAAGALVIVGTGSVGLARAPDGGLRSVGGWGFPGGDDGSGADLGLQAVRLAQQVLDRRIPPSALTEAVLAQLGDTPEALLRWCSTAHQHAYAGCAPLVFASAASDARAAALLQGAADSLASLAAALDPQGCLPLVLAGSVALRLQALLPAALAARRASPQGDALQGAAQLLLQSL